MPDIAETPKDNPDEAVTSPGPHFTQGGNPSCLRTSGSAASDEVTHPAKRDLSVMMKQAQQGRA
jgi:hypothetical protein